MIWFISYDLYEHLWYQCDEIKLYLYMHQVYSSLLGSVDGPMFWLTFKLNQILVIQINCMFEQVSN